MNTYFSPRMFRLVYDGPLPDQPVLTCELYVKWYTLYLVTEDGDIKSIDLSGIYEFAEDDETAEGDHCWNPKVLDRMAEAKGWRIDDLSFELMVGRWYTMGMMDLP